MSVRLRLALTVVLTGLAAAVGVAAVMVVAFQRFQHETTYERANAFLDRVVIQHDDLLLQQRRDAAALVMLLRNLLLFEPDSQLYLLAPDGTVLAHSGRATLAPGFKVAIDPVRQAVADGGRRLDPYVMGDDPERMDEGAVIAARALAPAPVTGYLYLVGRKPALTAGGLGMFGSSLVVPALAAALAVMAVCTGLALWLIHGVTRPLQRLSDDVAAAARDGFEAARQAPMAAPAPARAAAGDEFGRLQAGFQALLATLHAQWLRLQRLDAVRREGISNLSHDLRSPLTATVACLETLEGRWTGDAARDDDRQLAATALRNTRNAARMVRSLGDLAVLDEPAFRLSRERIDLGEVLDDIALRFAPRAVQCGVTLASDPPTGPEPPFAAVDIELFERAVANLVDNALVHTPAGGRIGLSTTARGTTVQVAVADTGAGIAEADQPFLFDRLYQARTDAAPATADGGKGLGLAIVKRIVELHGGAIAVDSAPGRGTIVRIELPRG